ncbi:MAG: hypothetical protein ACE15E_23080, partial [Acidobacteriota bacterium]
GLWRVRPLWALVSTIRVREADAELQKRLPLRSQKTGRVTSGERFLPVLWMRVPSLKPGTNGS